MPTERVVSDGVLLRRPTYADVPGIHRVHADPAVYLLDPHLVHRSEQQTATWLEPMLRHWADHGFGYWTVLVPALWWPDGPPGPDPADGDRVVAGLGGLQRHHLGGPAGTPGELTLNVYFRLAPAIQGRGVAGRIVRAGAAWAATHHPSLDLVVRTRPANIAALRVARREGFLDEGLDPGDPGMVLWRRRHPDAGVPAPHPSF